eukprot:jgi/Galph1/4795/GphlegSOOS_G3500.1
MALNVPLARNNHVLLPLPYDNELFILSREGIDIEITDERNKHYGSNGLLVVTTQRLVFVQKQTERSSSSQTFESFEAPFYGIWNEKFNQQPILSANNLTCDVQPFDDQPFQGIIHCKFIFHQGGVGIFLPVLFTSLSITRENRQIQSSSLSSVNNDHVYHQVQQRLSAFVDPSDPSHIYMVQP